MKLYVTAIITIMKYLILTIINLQFWILYYFFKILQWSIDLMWDLKKPKVAFAKLAWVNFMNGESFPCSNLLLQLIGLFMFLVDVIGIATLLVILPCN